MLNLLVSFLVALLIGGIIVGVAFLIINFLVANAQYNKWFKGLVVLIVFILGLIWLLGGGDIGFIHTGHTGVRAF